MNREQCPLGSKCPAEKFIHETAQAIITRPAKPKVETGWLVENDNGGPCWWGRTPDGEDVFGWTTSSLMALRFARKEDAEAYIEEVGWNDVIATEHQWSDPVSATPSP
jgi:hypothetical protein